MDVVKDQKDRMGIQVLRVKARCNRGTGFIRGLAAQYMLSAFRQNRGRPMKLH